MDRTVEHESHHSNQLYRCNDLDGGISFIRLSSVELIRSLSMACELYLHSGVRINIKKEDGVQIRKLIEERVF